MAMFVGLDVSLKMTSICVVEADGSVGMGRQGRERTRPAWSRRFRVGETEDRVLSESRLARCPSGCTAHSLRAGFRPFASRRGMPSASCHRARTRPTAAMHAALPT